MRTLRAPIYCLFFLLPVALLPSDVVARASVEKGQHVDELFAPWSVAGSPGCTVGVAINGQNLLIRAYGSADLEHDIPNNPATVFEAGSVSKQFTAAAIQLLAMEGKLSLDDDIRKYVPAIPDYGETITIRNMMNHTSGLRDWGSVANISGWGRSNRTHTHAHVLDIASRQSALNFPPGTEYSYSNTGYNLLAIIVSRVSGVSFAEFSKKRIFEPLEMRHTQWRDDYRRIVEGRSTAYSANSDGGFTIDRPIENVHGNGGLLTTVGDLLIWNRALTNGRLGGAEFLQRMHTRGRLNNGREISYAAGLVVAPFEGVPSVSHTGSTSGYRAFLGRYPDQGLSIALLCNASNANPGQLGGELAKAYLGDAIEPNPEPVTGVAGSGTEFEVLSGLYRDTRTGQPLRLLVRDGQLQIEGGQDLQALSKTEFRMGRGGGRLVFEATQGVRPHIRKFFEEYEERRYEPVQEAGTTATELADFRGEYQSYDAETALILRIEDGQLIARRRPDQDIVLRAIYQDAFEADGLGLVRFHRDEHGNVLKLGIYTPRVYDMRFQRISKN